MSIFVESLKRLFHIGRISEEKLNDLLKEKKINQEDFDYITKGGN